MMKVRIFIVFFFFCHFIYGQMNIYPPVRGCECLPVLTARFDGTLAKADSVYVDTVEVFLRLCSGLGCGTYSQRIGIQKTYFRNLSDATWSAYDYYIQIANDTLNARIKRALLNPLPTYDWGTSFGTQEDDVHCLAVGRVKDPPSGVGGSNSAFPTAPSARGRRGCSRSCRSAG